MPPAPAGQSRDLSALGLGVQDRRWALRGIFNLGRACASGERHRRRRRRGIVRRRPKGGFVLLHRANEAEALALERADQGLRGPAVADRLARAIDRGGHRRIGYDPPAPNRLEQFILADNAVAMADQIDDQIEDLGRDGDQLATMP